MIRYVYSRFKYITSVTIYIHRNHCRICFFFFLMIRRPPRSTLSSSSAASDVYKRQVSTQSTGIARAQVMAVSMQGWVPYNEREEWSDVTPVPQDDGPAAVVRINYSDRFNDVMGFFRHVLLNQELSSRAWDVTDDAIDCNPANYTAWAFRRKLIVALGLDLAEELEETHKMAIENPKNYQIWHHRKCVCEMLKDGSKEKEFTAQAFDQDGKNYHAWSHRQWAVKHFGLWEGEFEYLSSLIESDPRNNSAWNHRYYVLSHSNNKEETQQAERKYAMDVIRDGPLNDSAWGYLRGLSESVELEEQLVGFSEEMLKLQPACVQAMDTLVQVGIRINSVASRARAAQLCGELASEFDVIRSKYWEYQLDLINSKSDE
eukprot:TRINITY_DN36009_c0_g1_i1.p1 TRINITY_DN36009_c0_g1~~TRINITY_DN36009_c0_g1_i1.p1  ORF type:complete len:374 (-),score=76.93 TRINITY_DN36009_c0_g1_i1:172-1293(-)